MSNASCPSCGSRIRPEDERCPLCGYSMVGSPELEAPASEGTQKSELGVPVVPSGVGRRFCQSCGTASQVDARFCHNCGSPLDSAPIVPGRPDAEPEALTTEGNTTSPAGRQAIILVGAAAALVVLLFVVTQITDRPAPLTPPQEAAAEAMTSPSSTALPPEVAERIEALEQRIERAAADEEANEARAELVELLVRVGAFARAGEVQEELASSRDSADAWADAGSFYLAHMLRIDGPERPIFAQRSAQAYERALELNPGDLDVKTDLATAYLNDTTDPMRAVTVVQDVLQQEPNHARARFNYGLMLAQIGRNDQAIEQFERVVALTPSEDFVHQRAREELMRLGAG